ncbi:hypothetical protein I4I73_23500 [Pseudonocardia sp. KRD-184]|uniref:Secreted protein n=1 Tax=Pseudonocardia oceani TaxID=2792013 RepID=A0ABS6U4F1_9PSEU|nr:hypothetical protein [Pseudonocardia oceani]MBW0093912.1 hypothetical protein [Pseudonocardia oceani]MBW0098962.1 hypothetical protein [Pseudonocardia oceani]MBW0111491.1 hypothetical protein [Pseudonocardia oceani]MBW0125210.1 hypothetical protein [Pseudonocardia oceani]MBW0126866.1 hypothetical protein [Pseudonocardia oceani]
MEPTVIVLIVVVVVLVIALGVAGVLLSRRRRSERLQERYGPEYDRTLAETGDPREAESRLVEREKRHRSLDVRDLSHEERDRFGASWAEIQRGFVDDPVQSLRRADGLVVEIMRTRGYPVDDFERRAEDISVEHPQVVAHYREARAVRDATEHGAVDTEQQRHAVTSYRSLVEALLGHDVRQDASQSDATQSDATQNGRHHSTEEQTR